MRANKSLGQNFLKDENIVRAIAEAAVPGPEDEVLEIGPGLGSLTEALADRAAHVTAVEIDSRLIPILRTKLFRYQNVTLLEGDFLKLDVAALGIPRSGPLRIVGNLPYYITTPILMKILEAGVPAASVTVMVQKEVAEKIMAAPSDRNYGVLAVILQAFYEISLVTDAPAVCFDPRPKVDSAVIQLVPRAQTRGGSSAAWPMLREEADGACSCKAENDPASRCGADTEEAPDSLRGCPVGLTISSPRRFAYIALVKAAFSQRRKTLPNSLAGYLGRSKDQWAELLQKAGIDPGLRAEALSPADYGKILMSVI